jgi:branched-chain amino acid transport system substrate-binding protein
LLRIRSRFAAPPSLLTVAVFTVVAVAGCGEGGVAAPPLHVGAIFPFSGSAQGLANDEYLGASLAAEMVNAAGGAGGRQIVLDFRDVESASGVKAAADSLRSDGVAVTIGAYSSELSIPASAAVAADGMVYWETGAVADRVTGQGSPLVFRVGANGANLGGNSGGFVVDQIAPRLGRPASTLTAFLVTADDAYGHSVATGVRAGLARGGVHVSAEAVYNPYAPDWGKVTAAIATLRPDILLLSSHIPDGIAFRRAFLAARLHVDAFIGTTMAQCLPDFGDALGPDAVGVFASDRPENIFNPAALDASARAVYDHFAQLWQRRTGRVPSEEGVSGFTAAWVLFHAVLARTTSFDAASIAAAARALDLPSGSLPNGGGVRFSATPDQLGQNLRAVGVIWQWQAVRHSVVVWPATYATGSVEMVPLPK